MTEGTPFASASVSTAALPDANEIATLGAFAASTDTHAALGMIEAALEQKRPVEVLLLHLIAPAARWLEDEWRSERLSFEEVEGALDTLVKVIAVLAHPSPPASDPRTSAQVGLRRSRETGRPCRSRRRAYGSKR